MTSKLGRLLCGVDIKPDAQGGLRECSTIAAAEMPAAGRSRHAYRSASSEGDVALQVGNRHVCARSSRSMAKVCRSSTPCSGMLMWQSPKHVGRKMWAGDATLPKAEMIQGSIVPAPAEHSSPSTHLQPSSNLLPLGPPAIMFSQLI